MTRYYSPLYEEQMRREQASALELVRELREIEHEFRNAKGKTSDRALRAVRQLGWTQPAPRKYPNDYILLLDYGALRKRGIAHRDAAEQLRVRYDARSADAVTAKLTDARAALRRKLEYFKSLPADELAPGDAPEFYEPKVGYIGPAPAGAQVGFLTSLLEDTKGIPRRT